MACGEATPYTYLNLDGVIETYTLLLQVLAIKKAQSRTEQCYGYIGRRIEQ